jgi:ubiquinone/menaquinone biosynthesis C-methylase UbiE/uncharacterized protein YbaR (Trm112 family)
MDATALMPGYTCPDCRGPLERLYCAHCHFEFPRVDGIPRLLPRDPRFGHAADISADYDSIYSEQSGVWENQGRTPDFIRWFSSLLDALPGSRLLEIGCGEGFLLAAVRKREKFATDLSAAAIRQARTRTQAHFSLAVGERLPFPDDYFEVVTSVGVMEHFLDIGETLGEIRRILKPGGHYVSLTHVDVPLVERLASKVSEFVFPRPRPLRFARWLRKKLTATYPQQVIQHHYTRAGGSEWLARAGFHVRDVLHRRNNPDLPLMGPWPVIYVAQK